MLKGCVFIEKSNPFGEWYADKIGVNVEMKSVKDRWNPPKVDEIAMRLNPATQGDWRLRRRDIRLWRVIYQKAEDGANGFWAEIVVLRPEDVRGYVERAKTAIVNKKIEKIREIRKNVYLIIH